jgi:RNA polymerase sigma-70 factor (ECF subfamily)
MFSVPFEEIAPVLGRSPAAARQLASRARRRVQGRDDAGEEDPARRREVVRAVLAASRSGDFEGLVALLDPDAVVRADTAAVRAGAAAEVRGAAPLPGPSRDGPRRRSRPWSTGSRTWSGRPVDARG